MPELTKIDKFEKLAQGFYLYSMFVAPAWFMDDQFVDKSLATNPGVLCLCSIIGCLCACITALTYVARTADCADTRSSRPSTRSARRPGPSSR